MSTKAKSTLAGTILGTIGIVYFVHYQQVADKAVRSVQVWLFFAKQRADPLSQAMHQGVIRDMEQQRIKRERQVDFEMQRQLEEEYRKVQTVSDSTDA